MLTHHSLQIFCIVLSALVTAALPAGGELDGVEFALKLRRDGGSNVDVKATVTDLFYVVDIALGGENFSVQLDTGFNDLIVNHSLPAFKLTNSTSFVANESYGANLTFTFGGEDYSVHPLKVTLVETDVVSPNGKDQNVTVCFGGFQPVPAAERGFQGFDIVLGDVFLKSVYAFFNLSDDHDPANSTSGTPYVQLQSTVPDAGAAWQDSLTERKKVLDAFPPQIDPATSGRTQRQLRRSHGPQDKDKKSLFCCGELHRSGLYHKLKVHQQVTTLTFKNHPGVQITIRRDAESKCFHCPRCDKRYPIAGNLRDHMASRCDGYAQYRAPSLPKTKMRRSRKSDRSETGKPVDGNAMPVPVNGDAMIQVKAEKVDEAMVPAVVASTTLESEATETLDASFSRQTLLYPESQDDDVTILPASQSLDVAPEPIRTTLNSEVVSPTVSDQSSSPTPDAEVVFLPPLLRPATWSPINATTGVSEPRLISYSPSLVRSVSSCSSISLCTLPEDVPGLRFTLPIKTEFDYKFEPPSDGALLHGSGQQEPPTAAEVFLNGLRRPLGHAAPHLHGLGVVTEADLDLVCKMPDAWVELGDLLRVSGVTMIEWLMVKEAFKARAKRLL
ncbi:hypothetical protein L226DRAFT_518617 [Lentinus tigrinus ALCF2SS1-7]|uniref:uncharacterized protein n=1 Tax=Lentinus tigrinus ALCF2SS1-7 TaxID=1328758 RepID=UPI001165E369|nr:hypothetical protein L226DRAFT_518617 [Lentinus tigrinus ALCF2SS1-7]